jgi:hypothetical protein
LGKRLEDLSLVIEELKVYLIDYSKLRIVRYQIGSI